MSYGVSFKNASGDFTVDENTRAYVYLGKYTVSSEITTITCAGVPLIFFSVPHNDTSGESGYYRNGVYVRGLRYLGGNQWEVRSGGGASSPIVLRVFGRLDLNYPSGVPGNSYGLRVWDAASRLVFDSGGRMLRLAGNTYDVEIKLDSRYPGYTTGDPSLNYADFDTAVSLPFSMSGKSILANTRGTRANLQQTGSVHDPGVGQELFFGIETVWTYGYWASGSTLVARNVLVSESPVDFYGAWPSTGGLLMDAYTRLAVIDNSHFP